MQPKAARRGPHDARPVFDATDYLLRWLAVAVLVAAVVAWILVDGPPESSPSWARLLQTVTGDLATISVAYLTVSLVIDRKGLGSDSRLKHELVQAIARRVRRVPEVEATYARITDTPYGEIFAEASHLEFVGRWYNETLSRHPDELREFFHRGGTTTLVVMNPDSESCIEQAAYQYGGYRRDMEAFRSQVRSKAHSTIQELRLACREAGVDPDERLDVWVHSSPMNYWGVRARSAERDSLLLAPYDNFRRQALACPTVVFDLMQSRSSREFWSAEVEFFKAQSVRWAEWTRTRTVNEIQKLADALDVGDVHSFESDLAPEELTRMLAEVGARADEPGGDLRLSRRDGEVSIALRHDMDGGTLVTAFLERAPVARDEE